LLRELGRLADDSGISLFLVGGVVRDLLLGRETWDLDLTVEGDGTAFARAVADRYRAGLAVFERFATARLVLPDGLKVDIASTRSESYPKAAALPVVMPSSLRDDLYRRDFTINAMAIQLNATAFGTLHDPYQGQRDLKSKTLRVLHDKSFVDDPTRIFRGIRFTQRFALKWDPTSRRLLTKAAATDLIDRLSGPRLRNEMFLLLGERHPARTIELLAKLKLLRFLHPRLRYGTKIRRLIMALRAVLTRWGKERPAESIDRPLAYFMALVSDAGLTVACRIADRLQLSSAQCRAVSQAGSVTDRIAEILSQREAVSPSRVYRALSGLAPEAIALTYAKAASRKGTRGSARCRRRIARYLNIDRHASIAVTGDDLARLGLLPGPAYREILDRLLDARVDGEVMSEAGERRLAARLVARHRDEQPA
jgi:tRNA nucleotidyltransferase (CCA-adding enzyme)